MSEIQDNMLQMNIMNPMEYLAMRSQIEAEIKNIAKETITGDVMQDKNNPTVKKIMANPIYALMGGAAHFKGLNLEAPQMSSIKRLTEMTKVYKDLEAHAKDLNFESTNSKDMIEKEEGVKVKLEVEEITFKVKLEALNKELSKQESNHGSKILELDKELSSKNKELEQVNKMIEKAEKN